MISIDIILIHIDITLFTNVGFNSFLSSMFFTNFYQFPNVFPLHNLFP